MKKLAAITIMGATLLTTSSMVFAAEGTEPLTFVEAKEIALADAGLTADAVTFSKYMHDVDDGIRVYDFHFLIPGETKYEYKINSQTGDIIEKETEGWEAEDDAEYKTLLDDKNEFFDFDSTKGFSLSATATSKALDLTAPDDVYNVIYYKGGVDYEDGRILYKVGLMIPQDAIYDYEFDALTEDLFDSEVEAWDADDDVEYAALLIEHEKLNEGNEQAAAKSAAVNAAAAPEETAKAIALKDAGLSESDVKMTKCEKDFDDGIEYVDVEFIGPDGMKYEYEISVVDGRILDKDAEYDD